MLVSFANATVVRLRAATTSDGHGNTLPDWGAAATELAIPGCSVQPGATEEQLANRDGSRIEWTVYAPPGADVLAGDRVRWDGRVYEVDGEPQTWASPTGALSHRVILLTAWEG